MKQPRDIGSEQKTMTILFSQVWPPDNILTKQTPGLKPEYFENILPTVLETGLACLLSPLL